MDELKRAIRNTKLKQTLVVYGLPILELATVEREYDYVLSLSDADTYTFVWVSDKIEDILGYSTNELLGKPFTKVVTEEYAKDILEDNLKLGKSKATKGYYCEYRHKEGHIVAIEWQATPVYKDTPLVFAIGKEVSLC